MLQKFAHRSCQREWERNSSVCSHCHSELPDERDDEPRPVEPFEPLPPEPRNDQLSPRQRAVNSLHAAVQDMEGLFFSLHVVSFKVDSTTKCVQ